MNKLNHPRIMKLDEVYHDRERVYFVMDKMVDDLRNVVLKSESPLDEAFAKKIFRMMV